MDFLTAPNTLCAVVVLLILVLALLAHSNKTLRNENLEHERTIAHINRLNEKNENGATSRVFALRKDYDDRIKTAAACLDKEKDAFVIELLTSERDLMYILLEHLKERPTAFFKNE